MYMYYDMSQVALMSIDLVSFDWEALFRLRSNELSLDCVAISSLYAA